MQLEHAVFTDDFRDLKWDMMIATNPTYTEDADYTLGRLYSSPNGVNEENGYVNPKLHELLMAARTRDRTRRSAPSSTPQAGEIIWNDAVGIFPAELLAVYAYRSIVEGLELAPTMTPRFRGVTVELYGRSALPCREPSTCGRRTAGARSVEGLSVSVGATAPRLKLVEDVSLRCERGQVTALIGESGSGKSLTASAILGLLDRSVYHVAARRLQIGGLD